MSQPTPPSPQPTPPTPDPTLDEYKLAETAPLKPAPPRVATHPTAAAVAMADKPRRLAALDVFRGLTIAAMVLANNSSDPRYPWLGHADWHGWTPTDLIFPFFLFIVGVATPFSLARRSTGGKLSVVGSIWVRALALFMLGQLLTASNLPLPFTGGPDGFTLTKAMRIAGFIFVYGSILALLTPWPWRRVSTWLPIVVAVLFYGYAIAMHFVRAKTIEAGWPKDDFGGGVFNPDMLRIPGVLQRIGICYGIAATIAVFVCWRTIVATTLILLASYSSIMYLVPMRDDAGQPMNLTLAERVEKDDNVARRVDRAVLERWTTDEAGKRIATQRHSYAAYPDPEGIVSTLPAIGTVLIGILVGRWLRAPRTASEHAAGLLAWAVPVTILGCVLDAVLIPINKPIWTPSYTVFTAGLAMLGLGFLFYITDVHGRRAWAWPAKVMGMNAIAAFVASVVVLRICTYITMPNVALVSPTPTTAPVTASASTQAAKPITLRVYVSRQVTNGVRHTSHWLDRATNGRAPTLATPRNESLAYALTFLAAIFLITLVLYACRIFVKV